MYDVVHVMHDPRGGGLTHVIELAGHARRRGRRVALLLPDLDGGLPSKVDGVATVPLPAGAVARLRVIACAARSARLLHVHGTRAAAWALPVMPFTTTVVTFHGLHPLRRASSRHYRLAARTMLRLIISIADAAICVADSERQLLAASGLRVRDVHVIPNAVGRQSPVTSEERAAARRAFDLDDRLTVVLLGRLAAAKDPTTALAAMRGLETEAVLLVAGDGPLTAVAIREAPDNVTFLGHLEHPRKALAAADVILNSSRWEGLPLTLLEAMWAGIPIVASRVAGNLEAAAGAAIFVEPEDVTGFRRALRQALDPELRERLAEAGRDRVEGLFTLDEMLASTQAVYEAVTPKPRARA